MADSLDAAIAGVRRIESAAQTVGKQVADYLVGRFPLPLPESVRQDASDAMQRDLVACFLKENRPATFPSDFVQHVQLAAVSSFDARLRAIVEASGQEGGRS